MTPDPLGPVRDTLDLLVLKTLDTAPTELHGFAILEWIKKSTHQEIIVEDGALYHALHRMEERGWIESDWGVSEKGRRAKSYRLPPGAEGAHFGRGALAALRDRGGPHIGSGRRLTGCATRTARPGHHRPRPAEELEWEIEHYVAEQTDRLVEVGLDREEMFLDAVLDGFPDAGHTFR